MDIDSTMKLRGNQSLYEHYILCCKNLGIPDTEDKINKMLTCDYILANYDRHYRNFGAIRNVETLEWERTAPIFDSGSSLWARTPTIEIPSFKYKGKPFKTNPKEQLALVTDLSWFDIKKVSDFDMVVRNILSQNPLMDKNRINIISNKVKERIIEVKERKNILEKNYSLETHSINDSFENNDYEIEM